MHLEILLTPLDRYQIQESLTVIFKVIWLVGIRIPRNGIQSRCFIVIYAGEGVLHVPTCFCLAQVMAYSVLGTKPSPWPMPTYCQFRPCEIIQLWIKIRNFLERKCIWKCHLRHHGHFVYMLQCVNATISCCGSVHNQSACIGWPTVLRPKIFNPYINDIFSQKMIWFILYTHKKWYNEHLCNIRIKYDYISLISRKHSNQSNIDELNHCHFNDLRTICWIGWSW